MINSLKNEFCSIFKNKIALFVLFIAPLLVNVLLGVIFSSKQISKVPFGVLDMDNSSLSRTIRDAFKENDSFDCKVNISSEEEVERLFNSGKIYCALVIPKDFGKDVKGYKNPSVLMMYEGSNMSITGSAKAKATEILLTLKVGISMKVVSGKYNFSQADTEKLTQIVPYRNNFLYNPTKSYLSFINPGFGVAIFQTCLALIAVGAIRREDIPEEKNSRVGIVAGKLVFYSIAGTVGFMSSILYNHFLLDIPFKGNMLDALILSFFMAISVSAVSLMISALVDEKSLAITINAIYFIPSTIVAGYSWPTFAMPGFYQKLAYFMPFYHYAENIRNLFLKGDIFNSFVKDIIWLISFSVITVIIAYIAVMQKKQEKSC